MSRLALLLACATAALAYTPVLYMGDQILTVRPFTEHQVNMLQLWQQKGLFGKEKVFMDFWSDPTVPGVELKVLVKRGHLQDVKDALETHGIGFRVTNPNFGRLIKLESEMNKAAVTGHSKYLRYNEYHSVAKALMNKCGMKCSLEKIGKSFEGRDIIAYKLGINPSNPMIFVKAGVNAREWIAPATMLYIMNQIVSNPIHHSILDNYNLVIVGLTNPDGYEYSHTMDRMWRKNRRMGSSCFGVDLTRNFASFDKFAPKYPFMSSSQCSDAYMGSGAFSEPETKAIRDFVLRNKHAIKAFLSVRTLGQNLMKSYGSEFGVNPLKKPSGLSGFESVKLVSGKRYNSLGDLSDAMYPAGSKDWALSVGIPHAFTVQLPSPDRYGFMVPPSLIMSVGEKTLGVLKAFLRSI